jgi:hypothetical protein
MKGLFPMKAEGEAHPPPGLRACLSLSLAVLLLASCQQVFNYPLAAGLRSTTTTLPSTITLSGAVDLAEQAKSTGDTKLASALLEKFNSFAGSSSLNATQKVEAKTQAFDMAVVASNVTKAVSEAFRIASELLSASKDLYMTSLSTADLQKVMAAFNSVSVNSQALVAIRALAEIAASRTVPSDDYIIGGVLLTFGAAKKLGVTNLTAIAANPGAYAGTLATIRADADFQKAVDYFATGLALMQAAGKSSPLIDPLSTFINKLKL